MVYFQLFCLIIPCAICFSNLMQWKHAWWSHNPYFNLNKKIIQHRHIIKSMLNQVKFVLSNFPIYYLIVSCSSGNSCKNWEKDQIFLMDSEEEGFYAYNSSKKTWGLGRGSILSKNKALLFKWLRGFGFSRTGLLKDVIYSINDRNDYLNFLLEQTN